MEGRPTFGARVESRNGVARVGLEGELDMSSVAVLEEHLRRVEQDGNSAVMLDLRDLTFIDSSGLQAILRAMDRVAENGGTLIVVGAGLPARHLFELTGTEFLLDGDRAVGILQRFMGASSTGPSPEADDGPHA
jgi:anti-sigma B factor antagonist